MSIIASPGALPLESAQSAVLVEPKAKAKFRLDFLNGLRGLMALYVVMRHAYLEVDSTAAGKAFAHDWKYLLLFIDSGKLAVDVFIVLSGYLLMMPIVRAGRDNVKSISDFAKRRAFRVLPPYYIALLMAMVCILLVPGLTSYNDSHWDLSIGKGIVDGQFGSTWDTPGSIISHIFLVHNLFPQYAYTISHAMWSMGTETQLYFLFPLLLLPIWRRFGNVGLAAFVFAVGIGFHYFLPSIDVARPWYVINFGLGMIGASINFSKNEHIIRFKEKTPWTLITLLCMVLAALAAVYRPLAKEHIWLPDAIVGIGTMCVMIQLARQQMEGASSLFNPVRWIFESRFAMFLGTISFSLFLMHPMVVALVNYFVKKQINPSAGMHLLLMETIGISLSILAACLFYLAVEKWFIPARLDKKSAE